MNVIGDERGREAYVTKYLNIFSFIKRTVCLVDNFNSKHSQYEMIYIICYIMHYYPPIAPKPEAMNIEVKINNEDTTNAFLDL